MKTLLLLIPLALLSCSGGDSPAKDLVPGTIWKHLGEDPEVWYCVNPDNGDRVYIMMGYKRGGIAVIHGDLKK